MCSIYLKVQRLKIERLEQKLKDTEQKLASFTEKRQVHLKELAISYL